MFYFHVSSLYPHTGMAGAYSVSAPTKRSQKQEESKSSDDMYYHRTVAVKSRGGSAKYDNQVRI